MSNANEIERVLVDAFVVASKRARTRAQVASPKTRKKFISALPHFSDFDARWMLRVAANMQTPEQILALLRTKGAPPGCYVMAVDRTLDGNTMPLEAALFAIVGQQLPAIVSCVPNRLAYYEAEGRTERYVLERRAATVSM